MEDMDMRSALDFTPYRQSWIGFDHLFDMLENTRQGEGDAFPPFDLEQQDENTYRIRLAVAGFTRNNIEITAKSNLLVVTGSRPNEAEHRYLYRGISARNFERQFQLADYMIVTGASLNDGLLEIELKRELPDEVKPRRIEISAEPRKIEHTQSKRRARDGNAAKTSRPDASEVIDAGMKPANDPARKEALTGAW
jgi:molecular chaperone IbpA